jgi:hypothetical protein
MAFAILAQFNWHDIVDYDVAEVDIENGCIMLCDVHHQISLCAANRHPTLKPELWRGHSR